jgi:hypothetical protein
VADGFDGSGEDDAEMERGWMAYSFYCGILNGGLWHGYWMRII